MAKVKIQGHASGTGILTVTAPNTSTDRTITLPDATGTLLNSDGSAASLTAIPAANITGTLPAISGANLTGISGRRNIVNNGAMQVAQRGTSSTVSGYGSVDRWKSVNNVGVTHTQEAITSGDPFDVGFRHAFKLTNTATVDNAATHYVSCYQYIEAQDLATSGWDYTDASSYITISFWIKSSVAGTYYVNPMTEDGTKKVYPQSFSLSAATWTKVEKSFPGHADLTFDNDVNRGMALHISPFYGTDFTSGVSTSAWSTYASGDRFPDFAQRWGSAGTGATWEITGVQLELGSVATNFEHRSYGEELARCLRYFYQCCNGASQEIASGWYYNSTMIAMIVEMPVPMRSNPTVAVSGTADQFAIYRDGAADAFTALTRDNGSPLNTRVSIYNNNQVSGTAGWAGDVKCVSANGSLTFDAEL